MRHAPLVFSLLLLSTPSMVFAQASETDADAEAAVEAAFREIQTALRRSQSDTPADADLMVCRRRNLTGSRISTLECASNRYWTALRDDTGEAATHRESDDMFRMSWADYRKLERRYGPGTESR